MALLAWQAAERNEWHSEIGQAIGGASARGARMFSLADQHTTAGILAAHEHPRMLTQSGRDGRTTRSARRRSA